MRNDQNRAFVSASVEIMWRISLPPTPAVVEVAIELHEMLDSLVFALERKRRREQSQLARLADHRFSLFTTHVRSIAELAKVDLALLPSADQLAQAAFERAVETVWLLRQSECTSRLEQRTKWGKAGATSNVTGDGMTSEPAHMRSGCERRLELTFDSEPVEAAGPVREPFNRHFEIESVLRSLNWRDLDLVQAQLASREYSARQHYNSLEGLPQNGNVIGHRITPGDWYTALWASWQELKAVGPYFLSSMGLTRTVFFSLRDAKRIARALARLGRGMSVHGRSSA
jgi:hypothetical protein